MSGEKGGLGGGSSVLVGASETRQDLKGGIESGFLGLALGLRFSKHDLINNQR